MNDRDPANVLLRAALTHVGKTLTRLPGRNVSSGLYEVREFGPALRESLICAGVPGKLVALNHRVRLANWNRETSQIDLVVLGAGATVALAAELKVWNIGHQLFDLAKVRTRARGRRRASARRGRARPAGRGRPWPTIAGCW